MTAVNLVNNSSNTATIGPNVVFGNSSAVSHGLAFSGTGAWAINAPLVTPNGGVLWLADSASGPITYGGVMPTSGSTGVIEVGAAANVSSTFNIIPGAFLRLTGSGANTSGSAVPGIFNLGMASGATGIVNQTGGTVTLPASSWNLEVGEAPGSYGYYNMTGGSLFALEAEIGNNGYGYFNQSGGSVTINNWLLLGARRI